MRTVAVNRQSRSRHAAGLQIVGNRLGAVLGKRVVDGIRTRVVGVAVDGQRGIRILHQRLCGSIQRKLRIVA